MIVCRVGCGCGRGIWFWFCVWRRGCGWFWLWRSGWCGLWCALLVLSLLGWFFGCGGLRALGVGGCVGVGEGFACLVSAGDDDCGGGYAEEEDEWCGEDEACPVFPAVRV